MMKSITKFLAVGAIAAVAIAMSMAPSEAAKKRHKMAAPATCGGPGLCSTSCSGGFCSVYLCGMDGAWYPAVLTPVCPQGNCVNVRKKC